MSVVAAAAVVVVVLQPLARSRHASHEACSPAAYDRALTPPPSRPSIDSSVPLQRLPGKSLLSFFLSFFPPPLLLLLLLLLLLHPSC